MIPPAIDQVRIGLQRAVDGEVVVGRDGQRLGFVIGRRAGQFDALDASGRHMGRFSTHAAAARALDSNCSLLGTYGT